MQQWGFVRVHVVFSSRPQRVRSTARMTPACVTTAIKLLPEWLTAITARVLHISAGGSIPRIDSVTTVALSGVIGAPHSQFDWRWPPQRNCERCFALSESAGARNSRAYCPVDNLHPPFGPRVSIGRGNSSRPEIHSRCESNGSCVHGALCLPYRAGNHWSIPH